MTKIINILSTYIQKKSEPKNFFCFFCRLLITTFFLLVSILCVGIRRCVRRETYISTTEWSKEKKATTKNLSLYIYTYIFEIYNLNRLGYVALIHHSNHHLVLRSSKKYKKINKTYLNYSLQMNLGTPTKITTKRPITYSLK